MTKLPVGFLILAITVCTLAFAGCGGGGGSNNVPPQICDGNPDDPCVAATVPPCASGQISFAPVDGFSMTAGLQEANFFPNNYENCLIYPFTMQLSTTPFDDTFSVPGATTVLYFEFASQTQQFLSGNPGVAITVPQSLIVPGRTFYIATHWGLQWAPADIGPLHVQGNVLHAAQGGTNDVWDMDANYYAEFALYYTGA